MVCSNCNSEIKDGATYCLECGAPIDEPVVLSNLKPKNVEEAASAGKLQQKKGLKEIFQYEGKFFDFSGYVKALGSDASVLVGLFAALLVYLSPFFTWLWKKQYDMEYSGNLFEMGGSKANMALGEGILILMAVLIILSALDMLAFSGCRYIGPLKIFEKNYIVRAIPLVLTVIFFIVILNCEAYNKALDGIEVLIERAEELGAGSNFSGGRGAGPIMLISGLALYAVSILIDYFKRDK